jgi:glycosyltransferase involved in cell wall biosynthesis
MTELALAMIVKDEEQNLKRCLESVKGVFDEIIIVDTGSKDNTKLIAQSFDAKIYDFKWINDFAAARNFSFSKVTKPKVMWLDADDIIDQENITRLLKIKQHLDKFHAFSMYYYYALDQAGNPICTHRRFRIVPPTTQWKWPVHECMPIPKEFNCAITNVAITHKRSPSDHQKDLGRSESVV